MRWAMTALALLAGAVTVACGGGEGTHTDPPTPRARATFATQIAITPVPPTATPSATPATDSTPTPVPPQPSPRVVWMTVDYAGPGVATLRVATDVPTTAKVRLYGPGDTEIKTVQPPPPATDLNTRHTFSVVLPTVHTAYIVDVYDAAGLRAAAFLEEGAINGEEYFERGETAPKLTVLGNLAGTVAWVAPRRGLVIAPGELVLLQKQANCTTAQACLSEPLTIFRGDETSEAQGKETHGVQLTFPDAAHDYQVVIVGKFPSNSPLRAFYQIDVKGSSLK